LEEALVLFAVVVLGPDTQPPAILADVSNLTSLLVFVLFVLQIEHGYASGWRGIGNLGEREGEGGDK